MYVSNLLSKPNLSLLSKSFQTHSLAPQRIKINTLITTHSSQHTDHRNRTRTRTKNSKMMIFSYSVTPTKSTPALWMATYTPAFPPPTPSSIPQQPSPSPSTPAQHSRLYSPSHLSPAPTSSPTHSSILLNSTQNHVKKQSLSTPLLHGSGFRRGDMGSSN